MKLQELLEKTTICIMGQKGSGKTYAIIILTNLSQKPTFIFDTTGSISKSKLCRLGTVVTIGKDALRQKAKLWGLFNKLYKKGGAIFNLSDLVPVELVKFSDIFCEWCMKVGNMMLWVDEVADYCPQTKEYYSIELERVWRDGRNKGIKPVGLATQRTQAAHKNLLALSDVFIVFRMFHNLDRAKVKDLIGAKKEQWEDLEKRIMSLKTREYLLFTIHEGKLHLEFGIMPEIGGK